MADNYLPQTFFAKPAPDLAQVAEAAVAGTITPDFSGIVRLRRPNRLLYRCFPLTCARSQE